jgi:hypothetical protein
MVRDYNIQVNLSANGTVVIPAGYVLEQIVIENTTANAITGGLRIGTAAAGTQVVTAQAVAASALLRIAQASITLGVFSTTAAQTLFIEAVSAWNSANVNIWFTVRRLNP